MVPVPDVVLPELRASAELRTRLEPTFAPSSRSRRSNIRAEKITNTILGVPYYNYSIMGPKTLF